MTLDVRYDDSPLSSSTTDNWVARRGGLPPYVRAVARGLSHRHGGGVTSGDISEAIGVIRRWASGGGQVTDKTRAKAAAALAQWEALKASAGGSRQAVTESSSMGALLPLAQPNNPHLFRPSGVQGKCKVCGRQPSDPMHTAAMLRPRTGTRHAGRAGHAPVKGGHVKTLDQHRIATARTVDRHASAVEDQAHAAMVRLFGRQRDAVLSRLKGRRGLALVRSVQPIQPEPDDQDGQSVQPAPMVEPSALFDTAFWQQATTDALNGVYDSAAALTAGRLGDSLHPDLPSAPPQAVQSVADVLAQRARSVGAQITQTTYDEIAQQITQGLQQGEHIDQLTKRVQQVFDDADTNRARMIARTESIGAINQAADSYASALPPGVVAYKQWLAVNDPRTREAHRVADGQQQNLGDPFVVGGYPMQHPGDPSAPPDETINCRCTTLYVPRRLSAVDSES